LFLTLNACRSCNEFKGDSTKVVDPLTGETVPLFNSRIQRWSEHFAWSPDVTRVERLTAIGQATVVRLRMNNPVIIVTRRRWAISGWHPPINWTSTKVQLKKCLSSDFITAE